MLGYKVSIVIAVYFPVYLNTQVLMVLFFSPSEQFSFWRQAQLDLGEKS